LLNAESDLLISGAMLFVILLAILFLIIAINGSINRRNRREKIKLLETVTKLNRGTSSERSLILQLLNYGISNNAIFHDLYLRKSNGNFSQIDLVVPTKIGIIVFEVKDYSGWIFGNGNHQQWTQVLAFGKEKYRFYNPITQNNRHISELRKQSKQLQNIPFYSIIVFDGSCELKNINFVPNGAFITKSERVLEVMEFIVNQNELANYTNKHEIIEILRNAVQNGENTGIENKHIQNVRNILGKDRIFR
jgi:hypothetical protein